jgi:ribose-phosphate pyrophosphokinase
MIKLNGLLITPLIFPDKTSQVWKIDENYIGVFNLIEWTFENESELIHVAQLKELIISFYANAQVSLYLPYLPYARQDKIVSNDATFALTTFANLINSLCFSSVSMVDPHSDKALKLINRSIAIDPFDAIMPALVATEAIACFPDHGAEARYSSKIGQKNKLVLDKVRDQLTGEITGLSIIGDVQPTRYLIIDDICDGGRTFIEAAKALYAAGALEVNLYITHGIFSKGTQVLRDAGIKRIFTYKGEINENQN